MIVTLYFRGCSPALGLYYYDVLCDNGVAFSTAEPAYIRNKTRTIMPDDMCQMDSGWVHWGCDKCGVQHWTRTRPGGEVICPSCSHVEQCPMDAVMMPYEGADETDLYDEEC